MPPRRSTRGKAAAQPPQPAPRRNPRMQRVEELIAPEYYDMINEAVAANPEIAEDRPVKRRRANKNSLFIADDSPRKGSGSSEAAQPNIERHESIEELFEDVDMNDRQPPALVPSASQTIEMSDYDWDSDEDFEDVDMEMPVFKPQTKEASGEEEEETGDFDLNLTYAADTTSQRVPRKKARLFSKEERATHLITHKLHMLCLLRSIKIRNEWCNDALVQETLRKLLSSKDRQWFKTKPEWTQFRRAESIKKGLDIAGKAFLANFKITARGMRRAYWDDDNSKYERPPDMDPVLDIDDFRDAAVNMEGSRDVGTMLYCALLRACGRDVRLVCSLQLLPINAGSKSRPPLRGVSTSRPSTPAPAAPSPKPLIDTGNSIAAIRSRSRMDPFATSASNPAPHPSPKPKKKPILESPFPIFWLEVLDEAHQRWLPVDPLVTNSIDKRLKFEPPTSDPENNMTYVMAFDNDSHLRDVTKRYTQWYLAKTRKQRVESTPDGEKWLKKVIHCYKPWTTELDTVEDTELANFEAREKMPTSIADFKDHPRYVLERDLKRNEVLVNPHEVAKVKTGKAGKMESVYRRGDVKTVRSADGWYRHAGREVMPGEQPVKVRAARKVKGEEDEEGGVVALYTEDQTEPYEAPPVVNGRVPRNVYGNLDLYVPSMVPRGGVHLPHPDTARAARILGIDYADAVTGFEFRGRHGTAVVKGAVVAEECKEAVEAVIEGFRDEQREMAEKRRRLIALRMWKKFMVGLRIKERVDTYREEGEDDPKVSDVEMDDEEDHGKGMESEEYDYDEEGGFLPEDSDEGGGFIPE